MIISRKRVRRSMSRFSFFYLVAFVISLFLVVAVLSSGIGSSVSSSPICDSGTQDTTCTITKPKVLNGEYEFKTLVIKKGGSITHDANQDSLNNYLTLNTDVLTIEAEAGINVNGKGYAGGDTGEDGFGPGSGKKGASGGGAGYGGRGGNGQGGVGGIVYDTSASAPSEAGSGGGGANTGRKGVGGKGGAGGGLIFIKVAHTLTVNGAISANGVAGGAGNTSSGSGGAGSGGTIVLKVGTLAGGGTIRAVGGVGGTAAIIGGGGAGGRIVVISGLKPFTGKFDVSGGDGLARGAKGVVSQQDTSKVLCDSGTPNDVCTISSPKVLTGEYTFNTLVLENGGVISHEAIPKSTPKNAVQTPTKSLKIYAHDITINSGGSIDVMGKGYAGGEGLKLTEKDKTKSREMGFGPGGGYPFDARGPGGGGGHGWIGQPLLHSSGNYLGGGRAYDSPQNPVDAGSGGGSTGGSGCCDAGSGGAPGGGIILLNVDGTLTIDGTISANGRGGAGAAGGGGGGTINILTHSLQGSGLLMANGGNANGGGVGAGGRIAVRYYENEFTGTHQMHSGSKGGVANPFYEGSYYEWDRNVPEPAPETDEGCD